MYWHSVHQPCCQYTAPIGALPLLHSSLQFLWSIITSNTQLVLRRKNSLHPTQRSYSIHLHFYHLMQYFNYNLYLTNKNCIINNTVFTELAPWLIQFISCNVRAAYHVVYIYSYIQRYKENIKNYKTDRKENIIKRL